CQGRQAEAVKGLEALVAKKPHFCLGYLTLSQFSLQAKQLEVTVKACDDFVFHCANNDKIREQVAPEHLGVCYLRSGMAYAEMGDVESARSSFLRCRQTNAPAIGKECQTALDMLPP
ncbi:hypothetical protein L6R52_39375, partial [Myxococcota bacterium]|nr:hypothetical protein [Myxococcota bacterium]